MPITVKNWDDLPAELLPEADETVYDWHARIVAYNTANPGDLTLINAAGLEDLETRMGAYTDARETAESSARDAAISTHNADTTSVHGIADTSALATSSSVTSAVAAHEADTSVHGIADTTALATDAEVTSAVAAEATLRAAADTAHSADTTSVHGIADTSELVTSSDVTSIVQLTQAAYDGLGTPDAATLYVIVG